MESIRFKVTRRSMGKGEESMPRLLGGDYRSLLTLI